MRSFTDWIMDFENDQLTPRETLELFSDLLISGNIYQLRPKYRKTADRLIADGLLNEEGEITA